MATDEVLTDADFAPTEIPTPVNNPADHVLSDTDFSAPNESSMSLPPPVQATTYISDKNMTVGHTADMSHDQVNDAIQTQIYNRPKNDFHDDAPVLHPTLWNRFKNILNYQTPEFNPAENKAIPEVGKAALRGIEGAAKGVAGLVQWMGEAGAWSGVDEKGQPLPKNEFLDKVAGHIRDFGKQAVDYWSRAEATGIAKADPDLFRGSFVSNPSFTRLAADVAQGIPMLAAASAVTLASGNPLAGAGVLGLVGAGEQYSVAREQGASVPRGTIAGISSGIGNTILMSLPMGKYLEGFGKTATESIVRGSAEFAGISGIMTPFNNIMARIGGDKSKPLFDGMAESILSGAVSGGVLGALSPGRGAEIDAMIQDAHKAGVPAKDIDAARAEIAKQLIDHPHAIDGAIKQSKVYADIKSQLQGIEKPTSMTDDQWQQNIEAGAQLWSARIASEAQKRGQSVDATYAQIRPRIIGEEASLGDGSILRQNGTGKVYEPGVDIAPFKNTQEAMAFGRANANNQEAVTALESKMAGLDQQISKETDPNKSFALAFERQFYREARDTAIGKPEFQFQRHPEAPALEDKALKEFGEAKDLSQAGFILPDGRLIDFTHGGKDKLYMHQDISKIYPGGDSDPIGKLQDFMKKTGAVRLSDYQDIGGKHLAVEAHGPLSSDQLKNLAEYIEFSGLSTVTLESADDRGRSLRAKSYVSPTGDDVIRFFNGSSTYFQSNTDPTFFSQVQRTIDEKMPAKASAEQLSGLLKNTPGIRQEELEWIGLDDFLKEKKSVTKDEVQKFIADNNVQIQEVTRGEGKRDIPYLESKDQQGRKTWVSNVGSKDAVITEIAPEIYYARLGDFRVTNSAKSFEEAKALVADQLPRADTKFFEKTLPGGENYREMLLTLPENKFDPLPLAKEMSKESGKTWESLDPKAQKRFIGYASQQLSDEAKNFTSSHFPEPNVLAHVRFNERLDSEGKKVLFLEEVQSDWHQKGRKLGYKTPENKNEIDAERRDLDSKYKTLEEKRQSSEKWLDEFMKNTEEERTAKNLSLLQSLEAHGQMDKWNEREALFPQFNAIHIRRDELNYGAQDRRLPNAPFKKSWHELVLKRMLRYAAENGFDKVAWTTGSQQTERYWGNELVRPAVERFIGVTKPESIGKLSENIFGPKFAPLMSLDVVDGGVLASLKHDQIRSSIISRLPIDVVDILKRKHFSPKDFFSKPDMIFDSLSVDANDKVASGFRSAIRQTGTELRTKLIGFSSSKGDIKLLPTFKASLLNSREVAGLLSPESLFHSESSSLPKELASARTIAEAFPARMGQIENAKIPPAELAQFLNTHAEIIHGHEGLLQQGFEAPPGQGMKGFYDKIIPDYLNKYTKKWGGRVGETNIESGANDPSESKFRIQHSEESDLYYVMDADDQIVDEAETKRGAERKLSRLMGTEPGGVKVHSLDITPSMKESVMQGQPLFQSSENGPRGASSFTPQKTIIKLFKNADASTFIHESAHVWLQDIHDFVTSGKADAKYLSDWKNVSDWLGVKEDAKKLSTEQHEKFARAFESYARQGIAPIPQLQNAFDKFKDWLSKVYRSAQDLKVEVPENVKGVLDDMFKAESPDSANNLYVKNKPFDIQASINDKSTAQDLREQFSGLKNEQIVRGNQLAEEIKQMVPSKEERQGMFWYKAAEGDMNVLAEALNDPKLKTYHDQIMAAMNLSAQAVDALKKLGQYYEEAGRVSQEIGTIKSIRENYQNRIYAPDKPEDFVKTETKSGIKQSTKHALRRVFDTEFEAAQYGKKFATTDVADSLSIHNEELARVNTARKLADSMSEAGLGAWKKEVPDGWEKVGTLEKKVPLKDKDGNAVIGEDGNQVVSHSFFTAPKGIAKGLAAIADPNFAKKIDSIRNLQRYQGLVKTVDLSFSFFHHFSMAMQTLYQGGFKTLLNLRNMSEHLNSPDFKELEQDFVKNTGMTAKVEANQDILRHLVQHNDDTFSKVSNLPVVRNILQGAEKSSNFLFGKMQRFLKVSDYGAQLANWVAGHADASNAEVKSAKLGIAKQVNSVYGGLNWEAMGMTKANLSLLRLGLLAPDWCVDSKTRAMTKTGWKRHDELEIGDEIMAFDPETRKCKWSKLKDKYVNENYDDKLIKIKSYNHEILMTPEHTCFVYNFTTKKYEIVKAKNLQTNHMIPRVGDFDIPIEESYSDYFIQMAGWMVTDGHFKKNHWTRKDGSTGKCLNGIITQSKPKTVKILKQMGLKYYTEHTKDHGKFRANFLTHRFRVDSKTNKALLEENIDEGLSWEFLEKLTYRQLKILYDTMMLADGTGQNRFCAEKEMEIFFMSLIQTLLGKATSFYQEGKSIWRTRIVKSNFIYCHGHNGNKTEIDYKGTIWCPSVDTGFWIAEKDGLMFVTGNTISNIQLLQNALGDSGVAGKASRAHIMRALVTGMILTEGLNKIITGHFTDENKSGHKLEVEISPDVYVSFLRGGIGDITKFASMVSESGLQGVSRFAQGKLAPFPRTAVGLLTNTQYTGRPIGKKAEGPIGNTYDVLKYLMSSLAPLPLGLSNFLQSAKNSRLTPQGAAAVLTGVGRYSKSGHNTSQLKI